MLYSQNGLFDALYYRFFVIFLPGIRDSVLRAVFLSLVSTGAVIPAIMASAQSLPDESDREPGAGKSSTAILTVHGYPAQSENQNSAQSIVEFDTAALNRRGIDSPEAQLATVPDLNWAGGTARPRFFQIRGVGELEQYQGVPNSTVTVLLDGVDLTGMSAGLMLFDIERMQVFRGPQPLGFGPSGYAGTLALSTPVLTEGRISSNAFVSLGNGETFSTGLAFGDSIARAGKDIGYRITLYRNQQNGFRYNDYFYSHSTNERSETSGRAKLSVSGLSGDTVTLAVNDVLLDNSYDAFSPENSFITHSDRPGRDAERLKLLSVHTSIGLFKGIELSTISSYYTYDLDYSYDGDWGNNRYWGAFAPYDYFSHTGRQRGVFAQLVEISSSKKSRVDHQGWKIGAYYQKFGERSVIDDYSNNARYDYLKSNYNADTLSLFSGTEYSILPNLVGEIGGRAELRNMGYHDSQGVKFSPDNRLYGGEVTLRYLIGEQSSIYTRLSRGFRGGGFNANPDLPADRKIFSPEALNNLETGFRVDGFKGVSFDTNVFAYRRDEQQLGLSLQNNPDDPLSFTYITDNGAKGRGFGLESQAVVKPVDSVSLRVGGSVLSATFKATDPMVDIQSRRQEAHAPAWQYYADAEYGILEGLTATVSTTGKDAFYFADNNNARSNPAYLTNASLSYRIRSYEVVAWCRNIFDRHYAVRGFFFGLEPPDYPEKKYVQLGDPRVFGLTFRYWL